MAKNLTLLSNNIYKFIKRVFTKDELAGESLHGSEQLTRMVTSSCPLQILILIGGRSADSPWNSTTARKAFCNTSLSVIQGKYVLFRMQQVKYCSQQSPTEFKFSLVTKKQKMFSREEWHLVSIANISGYCQCITDQLFEGPCFIHLGCTGCSLT